jgi:hypothetical protein
MSYIFGVTDAKPSPDELLHYGVKGMRWGVRRSRTERAAARDAKEFARAKMFYGEGAGTRRKLIREKVNSRKKADPKYAKAFDDAYARQDLGKHGDKARRERGRKDAAKKTKQRAGYLARMKTGEMGTQAAFTALTVTGVAFVASPQGRQLMSTSYDKAANKFSRTRQGKKMFEEALKYRG